MYVNFIKPSSTVQRLDSLSTHDGHISTGGGSKVLVVLMTSSCGPENFQFNGLTFVDSYHWLMYLD